jgi:hypothetical protein
MASTMNPNPTALAASQRLLAMMQDAQRHGKPPAGLVKCPACGTPVEPTRTKKVRTHVDPLKATRCPASGRPWAAFGKRAPRTPGSDASARAVAATDARRAQPRSAQPRRAKPLARRGALPPR